MARPPRDPGQLAREVDTTIRIRDIREWAELKDALAVRFVELAIIAGLFCFSLALVLTLVFVLPQENEPLYYFVLLWAAGYILTTVAAIEFLIRKFRAMRRIIELSCRRLDRIEREMESTRRAAKPSRE